MFVVLIGSVAKNEHNINSDIDICRIDSDIELLKKRNWPDGPISYIDYSYKEFMHLYSQGSLFLYHILHEGILLEGNKKEWEKLKNNFVFIDNYDNEISDIKSIIFDFLDVEIFGDTFLTLYSNLFTLVKNYSIFSLAQEGIFLFNKEQAVKIKFGNKHFDLLYDSYNKFERGLGKQEYEWDYNARSLAVEVISYYREKMEG